MNLPFTTEQFLQIFADYNQAVWPAQLLLTAFALLGIGLAIWPTRHSGRIISALLALLWLWMGIVYQWLFFSTINKAAWLFGALFVIQGVFFIGCGPIRNRLSFQRPTGLRGLAGSILIVYALIIYPLIGQALGHAYPQSPTFGLPCPTTIFTLGLLLWLVPRPPIHVLIVPLLWSVIGFLAAVQLGIREDIGLLIAGLTTLILWLTQRRTSTAPSNI
jgi:hypothetical protein